MSTRVVDAVGFHFRSFELLLVETMLPARDVVLLSCLLLNFQVAFTGNVGDVAH
jgi:hypothetical protein